MTCSTMLNVSWVISNMAAIFHNALIFANSEGIWNNYFDIQQKSMQVKFIMFLCTRGYNSQGLKYKLIRKHQS